MAPGDTAVIIPARDEASSLAASVRGARQIPGVDLVVVVDDGSSDATRAEAAAAGAVAVGHWRPQGKAAAMVLGATVVAALESCDRHRRPRHLLFLDADLGASAGMAAPLVTPIRDGLADMTIGVVPRRVAGGGRGHVVRLALRGTRALTGAAPVQPLSGQRCLTRAAFDAARPLAHGFGVETGLTIDLLRLGLRVVEVGIAVEHRVTGTDVASALHRANQFVDVARALAVRALPRDLVHPFAGRVRLGRH